MVQPATLALGGRRIRLGAGRRSDPDRRQRRNRPARRRLRGFSEKRRQRPPLGQSLGCRCALSGSRIAQAGRRRLRLFRYRHAYRTRPRSRIHAQGWDAVPAAKLMRGSPVERPLSAHRAEGSPSCCVSQGGFTMRMGSLWRKPMIRPTLFKGAILAGLLGAPMLAASLPAAAFVSIGISVGIAPPPLPVYEQPIAPGPGYIWTPGYWAWDPAYGYYWVPGAWCCRLRWACCGRRAGGAGM